MRRGSIALVTVLAMAMPAVALAGHGHHGGRDVPCANAAVCQYFEHVPGGSGPTSGGGGGGPTGGGGGGAGSSVLSPAAQRALAEHGTPGLKTAALADATAPPGVSSNQDTGQLGALPKAGGDPQGGPQVGKALGHILGGADAGSGMGIAFPIILGLSLVAAILLGLRRRRWPEHA